VSRYGRTDATNHEFDRAHKQRLAGVLDRAAPSYDRVGDSYHEHFGSRLAQAADIGPGCRVLDVLADVVLCSCRLPDGQVRPVRSSASTCQR
jgi:hypothetical protein